MAKIIVLQHVPHEILGTMNPDVIRAEIPKFFDYIMQHFLC